MAVTEFTRESSERIRLVNYSAKKLYCIGVSVCSLEHEENLSNTLFKNSFGMKMPVRNRKGSNVAVEFKRSEKRSARGTELMRWK